MPPNRSSKSSPGGLSLVAGMVGMAVDPVLERVDRGDPGQDQHDPLEQLAIGPVGVGGAVKRVEPARTQKLHGHRGDLAKLDRAFAVGRQRLAAAGQRVEGMPSLVEQGPHVGIEADRVHENERQSPVFEGRLVAAGSLALAIGQIEQLVLAEEGELVAQLGVHVAKNGLGPGGELFDVFEGYERGPAQRIDRRVPWPQGFHSQRQPVLLLDLPHQGDDDLFDGLVKPDRVGDAVVEPFAIAERIFHEIGESRFARDLDPELFHLVEKIIERFAILQPPAGRQLPGFLADGSVGLFQKRRHSAPACVPGRET